MKNNPEKENKLNALAEEWYYMESEGNEGAKLALKQKMMLLIYDLYYWGNDSFYDDTKQESFSEEQEPLDIYDCEMTSENDDTNTENENFDEYIEQSKLQKWSKTYNRLDIERKMEYNNTAVVMVMNEIFQNFNNQTKFTHYFSFLLRRRKIDLFQKDKRKAPDVFSDIRLDSEITNKKNAQYTSTSTYYDTYIKHTNEFLLIDNFLSLFSMVSAFLRQPISKSSNTAKKMWYRLFFTADATAIAQLQSIEISHERDLFTAIDTNYLDFYMSKRCRTWKSLGSVPLKTYSDIFPEQSKKQPLHLPIEDTVLSAFLNHTTQKEYDILGKTKSACSNQRKDYDYFTGRKKQIL